MLVPLSCSESEIALKMPCFSEVSVWSAFSLKYREDPLLLDQPTSAFMWELFSPTDNIGVKIVGMKRLKRSVTTRHYSPFLFLKSDKSAGKWEDWGFAVQTKWFWQCYCWLATTWQLFPYGETSQLFTIRRLVWFAGVSLDSSEPAFKSLHLSPDLSALMSFISVSVICVIRHHLILQQK